MPIKKLKSKNLSKFKSKTKTKKTKIQAPTQASSQFSNKYQNIIDIIKRFSHPRNNISKSQNNLPARLMRMKSPNLLRNSQLQRPQPQDLSNSVNKSVNKLMSSSSSFSSITHNGHTHSTGKTIINNSNKPFIEIKEMQNGNIKTYMVPKNTIPYKPSINMKNINMKSSNQLFNIKQKVRKTPKAKKSPKSKKTKKSKYSK
jgi:hypothetical protein